MSASYTTVQWNRHKKVYDLVLWGGILLYVIMFVGVGSAVWSGDHALSPPVLLIRAFGTLSFLMLTVILCIGPLARLDARFAPLLYNRRHFGVSMFLIGLLHGVAATLFYHGFGIIDPLTSLLTSNTNYTSLVGFPFETLGLIALIILFYMAATSHDYWLKNLGPRAWKTLHMGVYVAFALLVMHVALGFLQSATSPIYAVMVFVAVGVVTALHLVAGFKEAQADRDVREPGEWVDACGIDDLEPDSANVVRLSAEHRVAVVRHGELVSCVSNVCRHQGGPLGEGRVVDGCLTCPWHGYQYLPDKGQSPPPYTETIPTYRVKVEAGRVLVNPEALTPGTPVEPASVPAPTNGTTDGQA